MINETISTENASKRAKEIKAAGGKIHSAKLDSNGYHLRYTLPADNTEAKLDSIKAAYSRS